MGERAEAKRRGGGLKNRLQHALCTLKKSTCEKATSSAISSAYSSPCQ